MCCVCDRRCVCQKSQRWTLWCTAAHLAAQYVFIRSSYRSTSLTSITSIGGSTVAQCTACCDCRHGAEACVGGPARPWTSSRTVHWRVRLCSVRVSRRVWFKSTHQIKTVYSWLDMTASCSTCCGGRCWRRWVLCLIQRRVWKQRAILRATPLFVK